MRELVCGRAGRKPQLKRHMRGERHVEAQIAELGCVGEHLVGRALKHDVAVGEDHHAVRGQGLVHEVRDVHECGAGSLQLVEYAHDAPAPANVQHGTGLVQHEQVWVHGERSGYGHTLLLAAGEAGGVCLRVGAHGHAGKLLVYPADDLCVRDAEVLWAKGHVVGHDARDNLVLGVLEHEPRVVAGVAVGLGIRRGTVKCDAPGELHRALVRSLQAANHLGQRGLARAVGTQHAESLAIHDLERYAIQCPGGALAVRETDPLKPNAWLEGVRLARRVDAADHATPQRAWKPACTPAASRRS